MPADERRARLAWRHWLAQPAPDVETVARDLIGLHATDPGSIYLAARARCAAFDVPALEAALYEDRRLLRMLGMRRTLFVLSVDDAAMVDGACTQAIAARERRRLVKLLEDGGVVAKAGPWLAAAEKATLAALVEKGEATGAQLSAAVPALRRKVRHGEGKSWEAEVGITTWVLVLMAAEGHIVRGRPVGSWISTQHRWAPAEVWFPGGMPRMETGRARAELARRWLTTFGPGTVEDLKWWTGLTLGEVRAALAELDVVAVDLDGTAGVALAGDLDPVPAPPAWVALLPALDPTAMGWKDRDWFLGPHRPRVFDRSGNIGPTVWVDGRVVGGWAQRKSGEVVTRLLEDVGGAAAAAVAAEAAALETWLGAARVTPRFRTPLEKELTA
jgi:hypothetical protein